MTHSLNQLLRCRSDCVWYHRQLAYEPTVLGVLSDSRLGILNRNPDVFTMGIFSAHTSWLERGLLVPILHVFQGALHIVESDIDFHIYMELSRNGGTPKFPFWSGFSLQTIQLLGVTSFVETSSQASSRWWNTPKSHGPCHPMSP